MSSHPTSSEDEEETENSTTLDKSFLEKVAGLFGNQKKSGLQESIEEILEENGSDNKEKALDASEKAILRNVLDFKELLVEDIMIPRADIFAIPEDINFDELQQKLTDKTYTRIPVYKDGLDEILGFLHIKDVARVFFKKEVLDLKQIIRKCLFVPASMKISNLLIRMRKSRVHIAIVVDEYGGTEGIVTLEDIVEEIVGDIEDEHDDDDVHKIIKISDDIYEVSSRITIEEFTHNSEIDLTVKDSDNEFDTIGGLVSYLTGRIPVKGEIISLNDNIEFEITDADARSIRRLIVKKKS